MTLPANEAKILTKSVIFCRTLRDSGLNVTPAEAIEAVTTLYLIDLDDRQEAFLSLRSVLTSRVEDYPVFEGLFEEFWNSLGRNPQPRKLVEREIQEHRKEQADFAPGLQRQKTLAYFLEHWVSGESRASKPIRLPGASNLESTAEKDFSLFTAEELEEVSRLARRIVRKLARIRSRRWKTARRGTRVDLRRTFRHSLSTGGEIVELSFKQRKLLKTKLVVICDVSGSMDLYSRILLQFVYIPARRATKVDPMIALRTE
ncbi:MAG: VWA domain-containing protein [Acidobacteria bacterium]|nr:VWA domain-containing protein [Acidobacteriota bacterium]